MPVILLDRIGADAGRRGGGRRACRAVDRGAIGAIIASNVEGINLGEVPLDPFWAKAEALDVPILIHPVMSTPAPRAAKFALAQIAQYTFDTTLGVGSLLFSGVLDRFPGSRWCSPMAAARCLISWAGST